MTKVIKKLEFSFTSPIGYETTSGGNAPLTDETKSIMLLNIDASGEGFADWSVPEFDIEESIGLWFDDNELIDYDGVFELPKELIDKLSELGYDSSYAKV